MIAIFAIQHLKKGRYQVGLVGKSRYISHPPLSNLQFTTSLRFAPCEQNQQNQTINQVRSTIQKYEISAR